LIDCLLDEGLASQLATVVRCCYRWLIYLRKNSTSS
jgi:hypothetical protein